MKKFMKKILLSVSMMSVIILSVNVSADDTDIFLAVTPDSNKAKPNVLYIIDTSGSMGWAIGGGDSTIRMTAMREAMTEIIGTSNDMNVGLMTFNGNGGPVRLPVTDLDQSTQQNPNAFQVVSNIAQSSDDAQEVNDASAANNGALDITNNNIFLSAQPGGTGGGGGVTGAQTITIPIADRADDINERIDNGQQANPGRNSQILQMRTTRHSALRFQNVNIPPGSLITQANLRLVSGDNTNRSAAGFIRGDTGGVTGNSESLVGTNELRDRNLNNRTNASSGWNISGTPDNTPINTADLSTIVQEIIDNPAWQANNALSFLIETTLSIRGDGANRPYRFYAKHNNTPAADEPRLTVQFQPPALTATPAANTVTGLRFQDIRIPQGATITNAYISVEASAGSAAPVDITIRAEQNVNPPTYSAANDISSRVTTSASANWNLPASEPWQGNQRYQSPDISNVIQAVVNQNAWCGGNALAIQLSDTGPVNARRFLSFDGSILPPNNAPRLHVQYDVAGISESETGCTLKSFTKRIVNDAHDARQQNGNGRTNLNDGGLALGQSRIGVRFTGMNIPNQATITNASLQFVSQGDSAGTTTTIYGHDIDDSPAFVAGTINEISDRIPGAATAASVSWSIPAANRDQALNTPDLSALIQEVVNRGDWAERNTLGFMLDIGTGRHDMFSADSQVTFAPLLTVDAQVNLNASSIEGPTFRDTLLAEVNALVPTGGTPITDTLYEGIQYLRGGPVKWGLTRNYVGRDGRVSHPSTYAGATGVTRASACTDANLSHSSCASESIQGTPNYVSPITTDDDQSNICGNPPKNYIIAITDGAQNSFSGRADIENLTGGNCSSDSVNSNSNCGFLLADYLAADGTDLSTGAADTPGSSDVLGDQTAIIHTVGFTTGASPWYMGGLASRTGGQYIQANNSEQLVTALRNLTEDVLSEPSTFTAPSLSISSFNNIFNDSDVYVTSFLPDLQQTWGGNIKKYKFCADTSQGFCDRDDNPITDPLTGNILDSAKSFWGTSTDGREIKSGGAGATLLDPDFRRLFTYTGTGAPTNVTLTSNQHELSRANASLDASLFGPSVVNSQKGALIDWIRGVDTESVADGPATNVRWAMADSLHSQPVVISYGGTEAAPVKKLLVGTNDGFIRMINAETGQEEWAFMPQNMLPYQEQMRQNAQGDRLYGVDGTPTVWREDFNNDGVINSTDNEFIKAFIGMRRGGSSYYGLDISPTSEITSLTSLTGVSPKLMWRIDGGVGDFTHLGQTWSDPVHTKIWFNGTKRDVVIFAGGYNPAYDGVMTTTDIGNAIYIVDADTGQRLWWASNTDSGADLKLPGMDYSIPSKVLHLDVDPDRVTDRLVVGDLGGNVWRIDLPKRKAAQPGFNTVVGKKIASLGHAAATDPDLISEQRKFMYEPAAVLIPAKGEQNEYIAISIATGDRANPTENTVHDRVFVLRDEQILPMEDANGDGIGDINTIVIADLYDAFDDVYSTASQTDLDAAKGWYYDLKDQNFIGEKALTATSIANFSNDKESAYTLIISTYLPAGAFGETGEASCSNVGYYRRHFVEIENGNAALVESGDKPENDTDVARYDKPPHCPSGTCEGTPPPPPETFVPPNDPTQACGSSTVTLVTGTGGGMQYEPEECYYPAYWIKQ